MLGIYAACGSIFEIVDIIPPGLIREALNFAIRAAFLGRIDIGFIIFWS